jgi:hypothetical protein
LIADGVTGWIAYGPDANSLEDALRRALATPPSVLAEMGAAAAASIQDLCNNARTLDRHLAFRRVVADRGVRRDAAADEGGKRASSIVVRSFRSQLNGAEAVALPIILAEAPDALGVVLVDEGWSLDSSFTAAAHEAFQNSPRLGVLAPWCEDHRRLECLAPFEYPPHGASEGSLPCAAFRVEAVLEAKTGKLSASDPLRDLARAVVGAGWQAAPYPRVLASRVDQFRKPRQSASRRCGGQGDRTLRPSDIVRATRQQRLEIIRRAMADPSYVLKWLVWHGRRWRVRRMFRRETERGKPGNGAS